MQNDKLGDNLNVSSLSASIRHWWCLEAICAIPILVEMIASVTWGCLFLFNSLLCNNCCDVVKKALRAGGVRLPVNAVSRPEDLAEALKALASSNESGEGEGKGKGSGWKGSKPSKGKPGKKKGGSAIPLPAPPTASEELTIANV